MPFVIPSVNATAWLQVKPFYYNADRLEETTESFVCNHMNWRITYTYHPWYGGSIFNITVYKVGVSEPIDTISDVQYNYILQKTAERYYSDNGTFFLKISAINIAYYYRIIIEQDVDSLGGPPPTMFNTRIALLLDPQETKMRTSTTINATLFCEHYQQPIPNQPIDFYVGSTCIGSAITDSYGNAVETYMAGIDAGNYSVVAAYDGSLDFLSCNASTDLIVAPLRTTLTLQSPSTAIQKEPVTLKATLKDELGGQLHGVNIDFQFYDGSNWLRIGSADTDLDGVSSLDYIPSDIGTFLVRAVFNGTENYSQNVSETSSLSVGNIPFFETPFGIAMISGIIAVAIIMVFTFVRKRKKG
jgi:hypothetical protein